MAATTSTTKFKFVKFNQIACHIFNIELNRPEQKNALCLPLIKELGQILKSIRCDTTANSPSRTLIISSSVSGIFCAGADLKERRTQTVDEWKMWSEQARMVIRDGIHTLPTCTTIAAIDGHALGGGLELALACDFRVMADNAFVCLPECTLAIIPGLGGTQRLARTIGASRAKHMLFTGRRVNAVEAYDIGLVNYYVEQNAKNNAAFGKAVELAQLSVKSC